MLILVKVLSYQGARINWRKSRNLAVKKWWNGGIQGREWENDSKPKKIAICPAALADGHYIHLSLTKHIKSRTNRDSKQKQDLTADLDVASSNMMGKLGGRPAFDVSTK